MPNTPMPSRTSYGQDLLAEAAEVGVHDVERHLHGVEAEAVLRRHLQHPQVDERVLVAGEADEAHLARFLGRQDRLQRPARGEDPVGVLQPDDLVELQQVDHVGLQPPEGLVELLGGGLPGPAVDLGHQEDLLAVAVAQGLAHADFAAAVVIVPAVVHEGDAGVDGGADDLDAVLLVLLPADMVAAQADDRHLLPGPAQRAIAHVAADRLLGPLQVARIGRPGAGRQGGRRGRRHHPEELSPLHGDLSFPTD
jgi:hypothetical protein